MDKNALKEDIIIELDNLKRLNEEMNQSFNRFLDGLL